MKPLIQIARYAAVACSLMLLGAYVYERSGLAERRHRAMMPGSKIKVPIIETTAGDPTAEQSSDEIEKHFMLSGSKSAIVLSPEDVAIEPATSAAPAAANATASELTPPSPTVPEMEAAIPNRERVEFDVLAGDAPGLPPPLHDPFAPPTEQEKVASPTNPFDWGDASPILVMFDDKTPTKMRVLLPGSKSDLILTGGELEHLKAALHLTDSEVEARARAATKAASQQAAERAQKTAPPTVSRTVSRLPAKPVQNPQRRVAKPNRATAPNAPNAAPPAQTNAP